MLAFLKRIFKHTFLLIFAGCVLLAGFIFYTAGDFFLDYLDRQLGIDIIYKNHAGFFSCFVFHSIVLEDPVLAVKGSGLTVKCKSAFINPDFTRTLDDGIIRLRCDLERPVFFQDGKEVNLFLTELPGIDKIAAFLNTVNIGSYDRLFCDIELLEGAIHIKYFELYNGNVRLLVSGDVVKDEAAKIALRLFLSQAVVGSMPEGFGDFLAQKGMGWRGLAVNVASDQKNGSLKLETERLKIQFGEVLEH